MRATTGRTRPRADSPTLKGRPRRSRSAQVRERAVKRRPHGVRTVRTPLGVAHWHDGVGFGHRGAQLRDGGDARGLRIGVDEVGRFLAGALRPGSLRALALMAVERGVDVVGRQRVGRRHVGAGVIAAGRWGRWPGR